ncbi:hypothetical protein sr16446 [Sporisorium reilianum SRZ2]|uniref:Uncharacterized protein n=1 Tax=Sporisorium reilianum (strain SRZ2) TaxID=999809 RepID=E6ZUG1_SPORE|nr:hypothetical protein sr16446 [Sporisorium reilianum SRZ2]
MPSPRVTAPQRGPKGHRASSTRFSTMRTLLLLTLALIALPHALAAPLPAPGTWLRLVTARPAAEALAETTEHAPLAAYLTHTRAELANALRGTAAAPAGVRVYRDADVYLANDVRTAVNDAARQRAGRSVWSGGQARPGTTAPPNTPERKSG